MKRSLNGPPISRLSFRKGFVITFIPYIETLLPNRRWNEGWLLQTHSQELFKPNLLAFTGTFGIYEWSVKPTVFLGATGPMRGAGLRGSVSSPSISTSIDLISLDLSTNLLNFSISFAWLFLLDRVSGGALPPLVLFLFPPLTELFLHNPTLRSWPPTSRSWPPTLIFSDFQRPSRVANESS